MSGGPSVARRAFADLATAGAIGTALLALDLAWLGFVARSVYDSGLTALKRDDIFWPAAALFYSFYAVAILVHAVKGSSSPASAARRGAGLGLVAYGTYELTNWAILRDWPPMLVAIDIAWGVILTCVVALIGRIVLAIMLERMK